MVSEPIIDGKKYLFIEREEREKGKRKRRRNE